MPLCFVCNENFQIPLHLFVHLNIFHDVGNIKEFLCKEPYCFRTFGTLNSFKKHMNSHSFSQETDTFNNPTNTIDPNSSLLNSVDSYVTESTHVTVNNNKTSDLVITEDFLNKLITKNAIGLASKWYSCSSIPRNKVDTLLDDIQIFNSSFISILKLKINDCMSKSNITDVISDLSLISNALSSLSDPFCNMKTEYLRFQILDEMGLLIRPNQIVIANRLNDRLCNGVVMLEPKEIKITLIPLRQVFKKLFEHSNFFDMLLNYIDSLQSYEGSIIYSFIQSKLWREKLKLHNDKKIFPLFVYFDDFEVNDPLGSHSGSQKLGAVYISLACLPPELASSIDNIFLASLFKTDDKKIYGNKLVFKDLISELNFLETSGIDVKINDKVHHVYFLVGLILGDNLGLHSILGFSESFVSKFPCRICRCPKQVCHEQIQQLDQTMRNKVNYASDLLINDLSYTGIKECCVWNDLVSFTVTDNFCVDIMHDMLEGVCKFDIGLILKQMIFGFNYLSIETLNNRIEAFNYGTLDIRSRPTLLSYENLRRGLIKMSASEMLCFTKYLGLIIGDLIPEDSDLWELYKILRKILDIILCKSVRLADSVLLKTLISEHHTLYLKLFRSKLKPKHHHMVHYPFIINQSGPLSLFWSMRFEAKHKELKDTAHAITSRKNIQYTLSLKHQLKLSYNFSSSNANFYTKNMEVGRILKINELTSQFYNNCDIIFLTITFDFSSDNIAFISWVKIKNILFNCNNMCIVVNANEIENMLPLFGLIKHIFITDNNLPFAICKLFQTNYFDEHYQAFNVTPKDKYICLYLEQFYQRSHEVHVSGSGLIFIPL